MDLAQSEKATRQAAIAAWISAALSLLLILAAMQLDVREGSLAVFNDGWNLLDVAFVLGCGFAVRRHSRAGALALLLYFLLAKAAMTLQTGELGGLVVTLLFLWFFGQGVRGAFAWHRIRRQEDPDYRPASRWWLLAGIPAGLAALALTALGVAVELGLVPANVMLEGEALRPHQRELLVANGLLAPDEQPRLFYSAGISSLLEDGNLLTDRRVVSWATIDGELQVDDALYEEVAGVQVLERGDPTRDTVAEVRRHDGGSFRLLLTVADRGDLRFIESLRQRAKLAAIPEPGP